MRVPYQRFGSRVRVALAMVATLAAAGPADPDPVKDKDGRFAAAVHKGAAKDAANNAKGNIRSDDSRQLGEVPRRITISATTSSPQCSARTCSTRAPTSAKPPPLHGF